MFNLFPGSGELKVAGFGTAEFLASRIIH